MVGGVTEAHALGDGLEVPAAGSVHLVPGSYRLLFRELSRQLKEGESFAGTLTFEKAGSVDVTFEVGPFVASVGAEPFALIDQDGGPFSDRGSRGKSLRHLLRLHALPDVCPTTLFEMSEALRKLGPDADRLKVVFASVDPARDTPELLKNYLGAFDERIVGLTGSAENVDKAAKSFRIFYQKVPGEDGDYSMDHSSSVILMDGEGRFVGAIGYQEDSDTRLAKLKRLMAGT